MAVLAQPHWERVSPLLRDIIVNVGQQPFAQQFVTVQPLRCDALRHQSCGDISRGKCVAPEQLQQFYLAGGTALALQLGHRVSIDLDFFSVSDELLDSSRQEIVTMLQQSLQFDVIQDAVGSLLLNVQGTAVGFFSYGYPLLAPTMMMEGVALAGLLDVSSQYVGAHPCGRPWGRRKALPLPRIIEKILLDIGLMKLDAIASRGVRKDFYDFYFIAQQLPLEDLLERGQDKYPHTRDFGMMVLAGLVDFAVADQQASIETFPLVSWEEVRTFCIQEIRRIGRQWFEE